MGKIFHKNLFRYKLFGRFISLCFATLLICISLSGLPVFNTSTVMLAAPTASEWDVLVRIDPSLLNFQTQLVSVDRRNGAINENKDIFISVGMQRHSSKLIAYGILTKNAGLIDTGIKILEYAFARQSADGSFPSFLPEGAEGIPRSVSFFFQDLGRSFLLTQNSSWFQSSSQTKGLRDRMNKLIKPAINSLNWLITQEGVLKKHDRSATNRILFHALAYYLVGKAVRRPDAKKIGENFAHMALKQQNKEGFFPENKGYDTSYNGVSLQLALILYTNLDANSSLRLDLWRGIEQSVAWQKNFFLPGGELSTTGNTRIRAGGERFLGRKKTVDYVPLIIAFNYYSKLSGDPSAQALANRTFAFYRESKERTTKRERAREREVAR
jgi:hypothetical protein